MTFHKGCCHMVKGISQNVSLDRSSLKTTVSHCIHESTTDANFCLCFEIRQKGTRYKIQATPNYSSATKIGRAIIGNVESHRPILVTDTIWNTHNHIKRHTKGYKRLDPSTQHKKSLPPIVFEHILQQARLPPERARSPLICGALFFAMRSCEYTYVVKG